MRYIDPYQLADKVDESMRNNPHEGKIALNHRLEHEHFLRMIALMPSADVEPVVHARWIELGSDDTDDLRWMCSNCNEVLFESPVRNNYCPNCGAKMDKENID